jgi:hypothetical protein
MLIFQPGCFTAQVIQVEEPELSKEVISMKLKSRAETMTSDGSAKPAEDVGIIIELRSYARLWRGALYGGWREKQEVYAAVCSEVMTALQKAGISASLIRDETDPRLENIGILLHVKYNESIASRTVWNPNHTFVEIPGPVPGGMYIGGYEEVSEAVGSYRIAIYNMMGEEIYHSTSNSLDVLVDQLNIQRKIAGDLLSALKDENLHVRQAAADLLGSLKDRKAVEPLIAALLKTYAEEQQSSGIREHFKLALMNILNAQSSSPNPNLRIQTCKKDYSKVWKTIVNRLAGSKFKLNIADEKLGFLSFETGLVLVSTVENRETKLYTWAPGSDKDILAYQLVVEGE